MKHLVRLTLLGLALAVVAGRAQNLEDLPVYKPKPHLWGEIRIGGNDTAVMHLWQAGFKKYYPKFSFWGQDVLGTAGTIGTLYTGVADLAIMGRVIAPMETQAFYKFFGYEPLEISYATGQYEEDNAPAMIFFVNPKNPLSRITFAQVDGIFGAQRTGGWRKLEKGWTWSTASARGPEKDIRTWGQMGLTGEWADKPIHVYGYDLTVNGHSLLLQQTAFKGGDTWNPTFREFPLSEPGHAGVAPKSGARAMMDAVAEDTYGIGYCGLKYSKGKAVKALSLAVMEAGPYLDVTMETVMTRQYPILDPICIYINRIPGEPVNPRVKEFLTYILSREGQEIVAKDGYFVPLTAELARAELRKLD